jgi:hypothetical protein
LANKKITELSSAGALSGAELVEAVQGGVNVKTTTQAIANLAPATPGAEAFLDLTDVPGSYTGEAGKVVTVKGDESGLEFTTGGTGSVTPGAGLSETSPGVIQLGSTGAPTVPDGDIFIEPENAEMSALSFGEFVNFYSLKFFADVTLMGGTNSSTFYSSGVYGTNSGNFGCTVGVTKNLAGISGPHVTVGGAADGSVANVLHIRRTVNGSGLTTAGAGAKLVFTVSNGTAFDHSPDAGLSYILTDVTNGSEDSKYVLSVLVNGTETTVAEFTGTGIDMGSKKVYGLAAASAAGEALRYEQVIGVQDLYFPASGMWPKTTSGCAALTKSEIATSLLNIQTLDFDQTTQEFAQFTMVAPRKWNNGTVTVVFYWTASSGSGDVQWGISGGAYSNDDALSTAFGTAVTVDDTLIATNDLHITSATAALTLAGTPADADFLAFQISRNVASDTLSGDAKLLGVSIRFTTDAGVDA